VDGYKELNPQDRRVQFKGDGHLEKLAGDAAKSNPFQRFTVTAERKMD
jgi:hypothetical protein